MLKSAIRRRCLVAVLEFVTVGIDYRAFLSGSVKGGDSHKSSFLWVLFFVSVSLVFGTLSNWQIQNIIIKLKKHHFIRLYCYAFFHNPISRKFSFIFFKKGLTNSNRFVVLYADSKLPYRKRYVMYCRRTFLTELSLGNAQRKVVSAASSEMGIGQIQ